MKKIFGASLAVVALALAAPAWAGTADAYHGKWSTWGCNTAWTDMESGKITKFAKEQGNTVPKSVKYSHDATLGMDDGRLTVAYDFRGSKDKYIYDVRDPNHLILDKLLVDNNVVFDREHSNSPYKDKPTDRCSM
ncbi:MAG: hypothetical protein WCF16_02430 [Alphaproteobacteria bacterium]